MYSRNKTRVWRLFAQIGGLGTTAIGSPVKLVYGKFQGSSFGTSIAHWLAALLVKAEPDQKVYRPSMRLNSFISPLLGPFRFYVRAPIFWRKSAQSQSIPITNNGALYV